MTSKACCLSLIPLECLFWGKSAVTEEAQLPREALANHSAPQPLLSLDFQPSSHLYCVMGHLSGFGPSSHSSWIQSPGKEYLASPISGQVPWSRQGAVTVPFL